MIATTATNLPTSNIDAVDPAIYDIAFNPQFTGLAYDALVNFQQSPGAAGLRGERGASFAGGVCEP